MGKWAKSLFGKEKFEDIGIVVAGGGGGDDANPFITG